MKIKIIILFLLLIVAAIYFYFSSNTSTFIAINELNKDGYLMASDLNTAFSELNVRSLLDSESSKDFVKNLDKTTDSAIEFSLSTINFGVNHLIGLILAPILIFLMRILTIWYRNNSQNRNY